MRLRLPAPLNIAGKPGIFGNFQIESRQARKTSYEHGFFKRKGKSSSGVKRRRFERQKNRPVKIHLSGFYFYFESSENSFTFSKEGFCFPSSIP